MHLCMYINMQTCGLCVHHIHMSVCLHVCGNSVQVGGLCSPPTFHVPGPAHECGELSSTTQLTFTFVGFSMSL